MDSNELIRLEELIEKVLGKYNQLKTEHVALQEAFRQQEQDCADLRDKIERLSNEKSETGIRFSGLMGRIEQWEAEQDTETNASSPGQQG